MQHVYKNETHAWVGECGLDAQFVADIPAEDDPRWQEGKPELLDTELLTLSPFYPSGRLGACVEKKSCHPMFRYANHPAFQGCKKWMHLDALVWMPFNKSE